MKITQYEQRPDVDNDDLLLLTGNEDNKKKTFTSKAKDFFSSMIKNRGRKNLSVDEISKSSGIPIIPPQSYHTDEEYGFVTKEDVYSDSEEYVSISSFLNRIFCDDILMKWSNFSESQWNNLSLPIILTASSGEKLSNPRQIPFTNFLEKIKSNVLQLYEITSGQNLNNIITSGFYYVATHAAAASLINGPFSRSFRLIVNINPNTGAGMQMAIQYDNKIRLRYYTSEDLWTDWVTVYSSKEKPTASDVGALPANGTAERAMADGNGNNIRETYATKASVDNLAGGSKRIFQGYINIEGSSKAFLYLNGVNSPVSSDNPLQAGDVILARINPSNTLCRPSTFATRFEDDVVLENSNNYAAANCISAYPTQKTTDVIPPYINANNTAGFTILEVSKIQNGVPFFLDLANGYTGVFNENRIPTLISDEAYSLVGGRALYAASRNMLRYHGTYGAADNTNTVLELGFSSGYLLVWLSTTNSSSVYYGMGTRLLVSDINGNTHGGNLYASTNPGATFTTGTDGQYKIKSDSSARTVEFYLYKVL